MTFDIADTKALHAQSATCSTVGSKSGCGARWTSRVALIAWAWLLASSQVTAQEDLTLLSGSGSGRATAYAKTNKIITAAGRTHVGWLDSTDDGFAIRIRTWTRDTDRWSPTYTLGTASDNHGGPALAIDSEGFLHVVYGPHHGPL